VSNKPTKGICVHCGAEWKLEWGTTAHFPPRDCISGLLEKVDALEKAIPLLAGEITRVEDNAAKLILEGNSQLNRVMNVVRSMQPPALNPRGFIEKEPAEA